MRDQDMAFKVAYLARESYSAAAAPASKEKRIRAFSDVSPCAARFPVLLFLGICSGGASLLRPRSCPSWRSLAAGFVVSPGLSQPAVINSHLSPDLHHVYGAYLMAGEPLSLYQGQDASELETRGLTERFAGISGGRRAGMGGVEADPPKRA